MTLSVDLDDRWTYLKAAGRPEWQGFPSYLDLAVPRMLSFFERRNLTATIFVVGQDAALPRNRGVMAALAGSRHDIANHSFHHDPGLSRRPADAVEQEIAMAGAAIREATGRTPIGYRGPSFSMSPTVLDVLARLDHRYDASTLPTPIGPLARAVHARRAGPRARSSGDRLFGGLADGFRPISPYVWQLPGGRQLLEMPVTTMPFLRLPFHMTYLVHLATWSPSLARRYLRSALALCRTTGVSPSMLLHPPDFLGAEDAPDLAFFPGMNVDAATKRRWIEDFFDELEHGFVPVSLERHALTLAGGPALPMLRPQMG